MNIKATLHGSEYLPPPPQCCESVVRESACEQHISDNLSLDCVLVLSVLWPARASYIFTCRHVQGSELVWLSPPPLGIKCRGRLREMLVGHWYRSTGLVPGRGPGLGIMYYSLHSASITVSRARHMKAAAISDPQINQRCEVIGEKSKFPPICLGCLGGIAVLQEIERPLTMGCRYLCRIRAM